MALIVGEPNVSRVDVGGEAFLAAVLIAGGKDFDGIDNPRVRHLYTLFCLAHLTTVVPRILRVGSIEGRARVVCLEYQQGRRGDAEWPGVALAPAIGAQVVTAGNQSRRGGVVASVVVAALRVVHAIVFLVGKVDGLAVGLRVVDGAVDVDNDLRVGRYVERGREVPDAVEHGCKALGLVGQPTFGIVVVIGGLCIVGRQESEAQVAE